MSDFKTLLAVGDLVTQNVVQISGNETIKAGVKKMSEQNVSSLLVVDGNGHLTGIVTERDVVYRCVAVDVDANTTSISQIMTGNPVSIAADESIFEARNTMMAKKLNHLIVVKDNKPIGVLTSQAVLGS
ncbi:MAG: CBS domain-containing protein [Nitrospinae bacterium]|nr:CBS domain-containing protein [Nitrospinota bacterium]